MPRELVIVACILLVATLAYFVIKTVGARIQREKLRAMGRIATWNQAAEGVRSGAGVLVVNKTNLFGRIWWVRGDAGCTDPSVLLRNDSVLVDFDGSLDDLRRELPAEKIVEVSGVVRT